jgi:ATP synthase F1 epsilon subunit
MENNFKLEIISPEKIIFSDYAEMVTLPSYEGDMSILKNHIPTINFLRPGIIKIQTDNEKLEEFFVEDGTVEYFNNILVVLSSSAINIKNISKELIKSINKNTEEKLMEKNITDHDRYVLNHKLAALKEIRS